MVSPAKLLTIVGHIALELWCEIVTEIACHTTHYQRPENTEVYMDLARAHQDRF